ncbi:hypothetical protein [Elizabethkingia anophelis]
MKLVKCMEQENDKNEKLTRNKVPWKAFILIGALYIFSSLFIEN